MFVEYYNLYVRIFDTESGLFLGSGFFVDEKIIVTCAHVVENRSFVKVQIPLFTSGVIELKVEDRNFAVDIAVILLDPPINKVGQIPPIIDINYADLEGLPCSVYGITKDYPNGAWTQAVVGRQINPYLIEGHQVELGYAISKGYSGSPVWLKDSKGIIGMIKGADKSQRNFNFIGGRHLLHILKIEGLKLDEITSPRLPEKYFRIVQFYETALKTLRKEHELDSKLLVIFGPSGIGKTSLAIDIFNNFEGRKVWIYARINDNISVFNDKIQLLRKGDLLVIEDVYENHPLIINSWLKQTIKCDILLTTTTRQLANKVREKNVVPNRKDYLYELSSLTDEVSIDFIASVIGSGFSEFWMKKIITLAKGYPLFIKIICDILIDEQDSKSKIDDDFFPENTFLNSVIESNLSDVELHEIILQKWCEQSAIEPLHIDILNILSLITNIGISDMALYFITKSQQESLKKALLYLRRKGFVSINISPDNQEKVIVIHQAIAKIIMNKPCPNITEFENRYIEYLRSGFIGNHNVERGLVQRIDFLVLELKSLWEQMNAGKIRSDEFIRGLQKYSEDLDNLLPHNCCSTAKSQWIAELFQPFVSKNCMVVIPIARVIARLSKCEVLAEMMWQGVTNIYEDDHSDSLARTCVIVSAFSHWSKLSNINKGYILKKVKFHVEEIFRLEKDLDVDTEIAVLIGGLCSIELYDYAIEIVKSVSFREQFKYSQFSYLILSIGLLSNNIYKGVILDIIAGNFKNVYESEAKEDVIAFLHQNGFSINPYLVRSDREYYKNYKGDILAGLSRLVSLGSHSDPFDQFVVEKRGVASWF